MWSTRRPVGASISLIFVRVLFLWLLASLPPYCVAAEVSAEIESNSTAGNLTKCDELDVMVDNCFKDIPAHLVEFLQTSKIAVTPKEIAAKCTVFHRGMSCFDEYTARCLSQDKIELFQSSVNGARTFFKHFCNDRDFQRNYLQHKDCFAYIQDDWARCTQSFQEILVGDLHAIDKNVSSRFIEFCCARKAYETCIYNSARYKWYQQSAEFAHDTARMLSEEKYFTACRQYEDTFCHGGKLATQRNSGVKAALTTSLALWIVLLLVCH